MCTAATYQTKDFYFGRNLDYEFGYGETVTFTPRHYPFQLNGLGVLDQHYAILGMACVQNNYPLYYDAINEKGLCIAGLNFVGNAWYCKDEPGKDNVAQFELIPWLLGRCATVQDARTLLDRMNLVDAPFCEGMPVASLHWMIADHHECITLESTKDGLHVYDNPAGVLTNNPPFPMQLFALNNYMQLSPKATGNHFAPNLPLNAYSRGMGAMGLPGDLSSQSRFVRAAFVRANSRSGESSFSIFSARWSSSAAAASWTTVSTRLPCTPAAAMPTKAFIITPPMKTARSLLWICTKRTWTVPSLSAIRW